MGQPGMALVDACSALVTVQDGGRRGLAHMGVPRAGAADLDALSLANRLVGSSPDAPALEVGPGTVALRLRSDAVLALAGAPRVVDLDGRPVPFGVGVAVEAGSLLSVGPLRGGMWTYVALGGGVVCEPVLGSCSADTLSGLGPHALAAGHAVHFGGGGTPGLWASREAPGLCSARPGSAAVTVRMTPGPHASLLGRAAAAAFASESWEVGAGSDRTGLRLLGPVLPLAQEARSGSLAAVGMVAGAIQVTPAGLPIVLGSNHGATGGYPVLAVVWLADLGLAFQSPPGSRLLFCWTTTEAARSELHRRAAARDVLRIGALRR